MIPFCCRVSMLELEPEIASETRQSTVTTSSDPNNEVIEGAVRHSLPTILYPVNRLDLLEIKRD